ncbi:MAG: TonB-dependent receptor [Muribaculaceae bacterium]|nr:TonB-dependent receptor [Muribaculaceae bacterium]
MRKHHSFALPAIISWLLVPTSSYEVGVDSQRADTLGRAISTVTVLGAQNKTVTAAAPLFRLSSSQLDRFGFTDMGQALKRLPGITLKDYGGAGGLKTVSVRGLGAAHTAVVYDGISLSECRNGEIDLGRFSPDNIDALSLAVGDNDDIFQPARLLASAATVFVANTPAFDDSLHISGRLRAGSFGYVNPFAKLSKGWGGRYAANISADFARADNNYPFTLRNGNTSTTERRYNSKSAVTNVEANFAYARSASSRLTSKIYFYDSDRQLPGQVIYYNNDNREHLHEQNLFLQSTYRSVLSPTLSILANAKLGWDASRYSDYSGMYPGGELHQNYYQREAYASAALLWTPAKGWAFDYSADYAFNNLSSNLTTENHPYRHTFLQSLSARWKNNHFTFTARALNSIYRNGSRSGQHAKNATRLNPSASISYRPVADANLFVRLSYKSIFRMPTFNESYFFHYGSADLKPETTDQFNLGLTWQCAPASWLTSLTLTADTYINNVKDKIVAVPYNLFVWRVVNLDKVRGHGVDISLNGDMTLSRKHSLLVAANYSYQRMEPRTSPDLYGNQIPYIPRNSGGASLSYENPWVNISANISASSCRYTTTQNTAETRIAGYAETGASLYRPFRLGRCSLEARIDVINIFNKQYQVIARYPMPGRSFRAGIKIEL